MKSFMGTSKNAVMTQIWIAMYVYLLLSFLKFESGLHKSSEANSEDCTAVIVFKKRDLMALHQGGS